GGIGRAVRTGRSRVITRDAGHLPIWSCSVRGFACHQPYGRRGALLPHLFTLTLRRGRKAVCFLCHCPSGHPDRALPGALPCGVRTFLSPKPASGRRRAVVRPAASLNCTMWAGQVAFLPLPPFLPFVTRRSPAKSGTARASCKGCC